MDWQVELLKFIQSFRNPVLDIIFQGITITAEEYFFIVIAAIMLWCYNKDAGHRIGYAFITSTVFNPFLKSIFRVERPIGIEGIEAQRVHTAPGTAFPSGHTQGATSFWVAVFMFFKARPVRILSIAMFILVGISRMYLGVHWVTDILGGILFAILWVVVATLVFDYSKVKNCIFYLWIPLIPFLVAYLVPFFTGKEPADYGPLVVSLGTSIGFIIGYMFEVKRVRFDVKAPLAKQILKLVIGLAITFAIKEGFKILLTFDQRIADLIRYGAIGFWLTGGAPFMFKSIGLAPKG